MFAEGRRRARAARGDRRRGRGARARRPAELAVLLARARRPVGERPAPARSRSPTRCALRARRVRALFACGLQEGVFPATPARRAVLRRRRARRDRRGVGAAAAPPRRPRRRALPLLRDGLAPRGAPVPLLARGRRRRRAGRALVLRLRRLRPLRPGARRAPADAHARRGRLARRRGADRARAPARAAAGAGPRHREAPIAPLRDPQLLAELRERPTWSASAHRAVGRLPGEVVRRAPPRPRGPDAGPRAHAPRRAGPRRARGDAARPHRSRPASARVRPDYARRSRSELPSAALDALAAKAEVQMSRDPDRQRALAHRLRADLRALPRARGRRRLRARARAPRGRLRRRDDELPPLDLGDGVRLGGRIDRVDAARRRGDRLRLQGPQRRRVGELAREAQVAGRAVHPRRPRRARPRAGRRPLPAARRHGPARRAALVLDGADPGLDTVETDRHDRARRSTRSSTASSRTSGAGGRRAAHRARSSRGRTRCAWTRRLRVPDDLPLRGRVR